MPTIVGMRRRGYTPEAIRNFCERIGVAKRENVVDVALLEHAVREDLNKRAPRVMGVLDPLRVVIENYPEGRSRSSTIANNPEDAAAGTRRVPFSRELYIERDDFMEDPPKKFFRLAPGREVRLRGAYFITCTSVVKDASGEIVELRCTYDPATRGGDAPDGRKVKATLHWVAGARARRRGASLRSPVHERAARREGGLPRDLNPASLEVRTRQARAVPLPPRSRRALPVRAARLLLRRSGFAGRPPRLQPHRDPQGHLGEDRGPGLKSTDSSTSTAEEAENAGSQGLTRFTG